MTSRRPQSPRSLLADAADATSLCAGWNVRLAARRITRFLDERMQATGLSVAQFGLMAQIAAASDDTLGALASRTGMDQSTLTRNLQGLAREGLVEIAVVEGNQRRRMVWLTETGLFRLQDALPVWRKAHEELMQLMDSDLSRRLALASEPLDARSSKVASKIASKAAKRIAGV